MIKHSCSHNEHGRVQPKIVRLLKNVIRNLRIKQSLKKYYKTNGATRRVPVKSAGKTVAFVYLPRVYGFKGVTTL